VRLSKWQGLGNDYLIIEADALPDTLTPAAIGVLCDRHLGVGGDGILLREKPTGSVPGAIARMRVFNPDGSEPEMCGNGIRMFARYLCKSGEYGSDFTVETLAGPVRPHVQPNGEVRVDMGRARFYGPGVRFPSSDVDSAEVVDRLLDVAGEVRRFTFVDVGNPHCVIIVDEDPSEVGIEVLGPAIERHALFPQRVNAEFVKVEQDGSLRMRVWERGVGETQACGTGATAVGAAAVRLGLSTSPVLVHLRGGDLVIEVEPGGEAGFRVFMTGPAEEVFTCALSRDLLRRLGWPTVDD